MGERPQQPAAPTKKWKATKPQIIQYWKGLRQDTPIQMTPIQHDHQGTTYAQDGVRITGSQQFIGSVLARLKEFLNFEGPTTKLALVYRETDSPSNLTSDNKTSFVFYIQSKDRGAGGVPGAGTPQLPEPKKVMPPSSPSS